MWINTGWTPCAFFSEGCYNTTNNSRSMFTTHRNNCKHLHVASFDPTMCIYPLWASCTHTHTISFAFQPIYSVVSIVSNPFVACAAHTILRTYSTSSHSMNGSHWNVNIVVCVCVLPFTHLHIYILFCVSRAFSGMREPSVVLFFGWHCQTTPEHSIKEYTVFLRRFTSLYSHSEEGKSIF